MSASAREKRLNKDVTLSRLYNLHLDKVLRQVRGRWCAEGWRRPDLGCWWIQMVYCCFESQRRNCSLWRFNLSCCLSGGNWIWMKRKGKIFTCEWKEPPSGTVSDGNQPEKGSRCRSVWDILNREDRNGRWRLDRYNRYMLKQFHQGCRWEGRV